MTRIIKNINHFICSSFFVGFWTLLCLFNTPIIGQAQAKISSTNLLWVGHSERIKSLDSLIHKAGTMALKTSNYNHLYLELVLKNSIKLLNERDSIKTDSLVNSIAIQFFKHVAYGNQAPALQSVGFVFKKDSYNMDVLVKKHAASNTLPELVRLFNVQSKEVTALLATLKTYQDSTKKMPSKINHLIRAVNNYRWLRGISERQRVVLVNIPSAQLKVYERDNILLSMKLILGKTSTPSKMFSTTIRQITINPYWVVPSSIAIKEMLLKLQNDNGYIDRNHLQILNEDYQKINANSVNWNNYSANYFPFTIRQSTGCDNSLGVIKLEFDSPFGVYLHDTPEKSLFNYKSRYFSHGCMRMEKPIDMAKLLMQQNSAALDTIDLESCYKNPNPITIPIPIQTPLVVWYNLVDFDETGTIKFYKDVYHRFTY